MNAKTAIEFQVFGRVQGVGFRAFTAREARSLRLNGWVRNRSDGSVEGVAVGLEVNLTEFVDRLRRGPTYANVGSLRFEWIAADDWPEFTVRW